MFDYKRNIIVCKCIVTQYMSIFTTQPKCPEHDAYVIIFL